MASNLVAMASTYSKELLAKYFDLAWTISTHVSFRLSKPSNGDHVSWTPKETHCEAKRSLTTLSDFHSTPLNHEHFRKSTELQKRPPDFSQSTPKSSSCHMGTSKYHAPTLSKGANKCSGRKSMPCSQFETSPVTGDLAGRLGQGDRQRRVRVARKG